jgi:hypothetical protein
MKIHENTIQVSQGYALFQETNGHRYLHGLAPRGIHPDTLKQYVNGPGYWFMADHGTFAINNEESASAMIELFTEKESAQ